MLCVYMAMIQENMVIWSMATWKTTKLCQALSRLARVEVCNLIMKTFYQDQTTRLAELQQLGLQMETTGRFSPETVRRWRVRPVCLTCPSMQFGQWQPRGVDTVTTLSCGCPRPPPCPRPTWSASMAAGARTRRRWGTRRSGRLSLTSSSRWWRSYPHCREVSGLFV